MLSRVRTEDIYDAALDDDCFVRLSSVLSNALGARSGVLHWRHADASEGEVSQSGYFSAEQMAHYGRHFASDDLWSNAVQVAPTANRAWNCEQLIPGPVYERSAIYNEWIRPMGDDTFHCMGAVIRADWGTAEIGLHRGRSQPAFDEDTVGLLTEHLSHIQRMLGIRARLVATDRRRAETVGALNALAQGVMTLDAGGKLLHCNEAAEAILRRGDGVYLQRGMLCARSTSDNSALKAAIARAAEPSGAQACEAIARGQGGRYYCLSLVAVSAGVAGRQIIVALSDSSAIDESLPARLRTLFNLTESEAFLAVRLSQGATVSEVAEEKGTTADTVRTQLKSISSKMGCRRQAEIVARVKDLPRLRVPN